MNYLKCLACRIRDRIDPDSPVPVDLDEIERLQIEALKLKNQIVETHLRLVVSVAKKYVRAGYDLPERISDGTFALMLAVDRFDFARGNRFSTYATWAIINELKAYDRREGRHRNRPFALYEDSLAVADPGSESTSAKRRRTRARAAVERLLGSARRARATDPREPITGSAAGPNRRCTQIGRDLGISKERVRQIEHAPTPSSGDSPASRRSSPRISKTRKRPTHHEHQPDCPGSRSGPGACPRAFGRS